MANLDTRSKRASSAQVLAPYVLAPPLPDGTIARGDRQHIAFSYSGILAAGGYYNYGFLPTFRRRKKQ